MQADRIQAAEATRRAAMDAQAAQAANMAQVMESINSLKQEQTQSKIITATKVQEPDQHADKIARGSDGGGS